MPTAPLRPCPSPRCPGLAGRCEQHPPRDTRHGWQNAAGTHTTRLRGRALQRARAELFTREPLCRTCQAQGRVTIATVRDHIIPLAEGGTDGPGNVQGLCGDCHQAKTQAEAQRGAARHR
jgi:5-methylcytosine-specific restriction enzyme A